MGEKRIRPDWDGIPADLLEVAQRYAAQPVPQPTPQQTRRLVDRLLAEQSRAVPASSARPRPAMAALRVARWRVRLMSAWFWVVSVPLLALVLAITAINAPSGGMVPMVLLLPLTAVLGLAQAARTPSRGLRDIEMACPVGGVTVIAAAALAIVVLDCAFGLVATALLALLSWAPFTTLLVAWLGPVLLLAALSLPVALRWGAIPAIALGAGPWLVLALIAAIIPGSSAAAVFTLPRDTFSFTLHLIAAVVGAVGLLLFLRDAAWHRRLIQVAG